MKIGIITFTYGDNYGQRLQNYASQYVFEQLGIENYTIYQKKPLKRMISDWIGGIKSGGWLRNAKRSRSFKCFDNQFIKYYGTIVGEKIYPKHLHDEFDYFVAGSDQIWSPYSRDVNRNMFLAFAPKEKRIAYVPSIGADELPAERIDEYKEYFEGFDHISVREESARDIVYKCSGKDAKVLIDPTLMVPVEEWEKLEKKPRIDINEKYVLYYHLGTDTHFDKVKEIAEDTDSIIIDITKDDKFYGLGPSEFLWLIHHAEVIVTDSYHGTIFSLIYHRSFWICNRTGGSVNMNGRFQTLITKFPETQHLISAYKKDEIFNFQAFEEKRKIEIVNATKYIKMCIGL